MFTNPAMGDEEDEVDQVCLKRLEEEITKLQSQLQILVQKKTAILKRVKRPAPNSGADPQTTKRQRLDLTDVAANVEIPTEQNDYRRVQENESKENEKEKTNTHAEKQNKENQGEWKTVHSKRVPPIFVYGIKNWLSLATLLKQLCKEDFTARSGPDNIKIQLKSPDDYRSVTLYMENEGVEFHTYNTEKSNILKVIIKNIPSTIKPDELKQALGERNFEPTHVGQLKDRMGTPLPMYQVTLPKNEKSKEIFGITDIIHCKVRVEAYRKAKNDNITQCHRCQRFGHTANYCKAEPRCVKCAMSHLTRDCLKNDTKKPAKCINCGLDHPAS